MTRLNQEKLHHIIKDILVYSHETKKRNFQETIELQFKLKGYNISKDKRFVGSIKLPNIIKPKLKIGIIGEKLHLEQAQEMGVNNFDTNFLVALNKEKKAIKSWTRKHEIFFASEGLIKNLNKLLGKEFNKTGKFPAPIRSGDKVIDIVDEAKRTARFKLKKSIAFGVPVANVGLNEQQIFDNVMLCCNFLVTLLKKGWQSIATIYIHPTMSKPHRIF